MTSVLSGKRIVLGVTGGIAAYKAADLASKLTQHGAQVDVILTHSATRFVTADTFAAITGRQVHERVLERWGDGWHGHITLGHEADLVVVAPATAESIARLATGNAADMLGAAILAASAPVLVAPAMEHNMLHHPATQRNLAILQSYGYTVVGPDTGRLASGDSGDGRLVPPEQIVGVARVLLGAKGCLAKRKIVVSAGGTQEHLDPVRYLGNSSSGLMGYAIAQAAIDQGAEVTLVAGPVCLDAPYGATLVQVISALEMQDALERATSNVDALVMAAAVADFRPATPSHHKIKKKGGDSLTIQLEKNPDIVGSIEQPGMVKIGFAAETSDLLVNARAKLKAKNLDMIVANDAEATIGSADSAATILTPDGSAEELPRMSKILLAELLAERLAALLNSGA